MVIPACLPAGRQSFSGNPEFGSPIKAFGDDNTRIGDDEMIKLKKISPVHPGEILMEEFIVPFGLNQTQLAKSIHVSPRRVNEIVQGKRSVSADTALRLSRYFGTSAQFWLGLQMDYDLDAQKDKFGKCVYDKIQKRREKILASKKQPK